MGRHHKLSLESVTNKTSRWPTIAPSTRTHCLHSQNPRGRTLPPTANRHTLNNLILQATQHFNNSNSSNNSTRSLPLLFQISTALLDTHRDTRPECNLQTMAMGPLLLVAMVKDQLLSRTDPHQFQDLLRPPLLPTAQTLPFGLSSRQLTKMEPAI